MSLFGLLRVHIPNLNIYSYYCKCQFCGQVNPTFSLSVFLLLPVCVMEVISFLLSFVLFALLNSKVLKDHH